MPRFVLYRTLDCDSFSSELVLRLHRPSSAMGVNHSVVGIECARGICAALCVVAPLHCLCVFSLNVQVSARQHLRVLAELVHHHAIRSTSSFAAAL